MELKRTGLFRLKTVFTPFNSGYRIYFSCKCKLQMSGLFIFLLFLFSGVFTLARHYSLHSVGGGGGDVTGIKIFKKINYSYASLFI
jgi:hypothetical protein